MTYTYLIHRLRSYFLGHNMTASQVASAAGVNWRTANRLVCGDGRLAPESIRKFEAIVPAEYTPPHKGETA